MGKATDLFEQSDIEVEKLTNDQRLKLIEGINLRTRNAENVLERRARLAEEQATERMRDRGDLINDYAKIESNERMAVLDNITKLRVGLENSRAQTYKSRPAAGRGYLDRARYNPRGKRDAINLLTKSISDPGAVQPGSKISDYEFEHFFDRILQDRGSFGMYWDPNVQNPDGSRGNVSFEPGVEVSEFAKRQLRDMGQRYEQVKENRIAVQGEIATEIQRLESLEQRVRAQPGKTISDSDLQKVQREMKNSADRINRQLNERDRKVGDAAREDLDDYLADDKAFQAQMAMLKELDPKKKEDIITEEALQWARARGLKVGKFAADGSYIPGREDDTMIIAFGMEARKSARGDGSIAYFGSSGKTGEMVTIQYQTDKIENFRDEFGNVYKDEDGNLVNPEELRRSREENIEGALYQTTHDGKVYQVVQEGGDVGVFDAESGAFVGDDDLRAAVVRNPLELLYRLGEDGKPRYAKFGDGGKAKTRSVIISGSESGDALNKDFDLIDPSVKVPDGLVRLTDSEIDTVLKTGEGFSVTESAFVMAPHASDMLTGNLGKTRYRTVGGKEIVLSDDELLSKESMGSFRKDRATLGELVRLGRDKRDVKRFTRNAEIAASQGNEQAKDWLQQQADATAKNNEARVKEFEIEQLEAAEEPPTPPTAEELAAEEISAEEQAGLQQELTTKETETVELKEEDDEKALVPESADPAAPDAALTDEEKQAAEEVLKIRDEATDGFVQGTARPQIGSLGEAQEKESAMIAGQLEIEEEAPAEETEVASVDITESPAEQKREQPEAPPKATQKVRGPDPDAFKGAVSDELDMAQVGIPLPSRPMPGSADTEKAKGIARPKATESYSFNVTEEDRAVADSLEEDAKLNLKEKVAKFGERVGLRRKKKQEDGVVEADAEQ
jgi:hypothetical protein